MTRSLRTLGAALVAVIALVTITGCARLRDRADTTDLSWDAQALASMGVPAADLAPAAEGATPSPGPARFPRLRYVFRNTLHGEATVQTEEGTRTVVVQRGEVTQLDATSVTLRSEDGFTLTWALDGRTVVVVDRTRSSLDKVAVGASLAVAGSRGGDVVTARLAVVPRQ